METDQTVRRSWKGIRLRGDVGREGTTLSGKDEMQGTTEAPCLPETPYHVGRPLGGGLRYRDQVSKKGTKL